MSALPIHVRTEGHVWILLEVIAVIVNLDITATTAKRVSGLPHKYHLLTRRKLL